MAESAPRFVRIVNDDGVGHHTRIFDEAGVDITESLNVAEIEIAIRPDGFVEAVLHTLVSRAEMYARIREVVETVVPPLPEKPRLELTIYEPSRRWWGAERSRYRLERVQPLSDYGQGRYALAEGWMPPMGYVVLHVDLDPLPA